MDFTLDDEQQAIHDITKQVLGDLSTHSRLKDRRSPTIMSTATPGLPSPKPVFRPRSPRPMAAQDSASPRRWPWRSPATTRADPAPLHDRHGGDADRRVRYRCPAGRLAAARAEGSLRAAALYEQGTAPGEPLTTARADGDGFVLDGVKPMVDQGLEAGLLVVPPASTTARSGVPRTHRRRWCDSPASRGHHRTSAGSCHPRWCGRRCRSTPRWS